MTDKLTLDDPVLQQVIKENDIKLAKNGDPAYPPGSRNKLPQTQNDYPASAPELFTKTFSVELTPQQEARIIREGAMRNISPIQFLQQVVDERLSENVGKAPITSPSWASGKKVTAPTNDFGFQPD